MERNYDLINSIKELGGSVRVDFFEAIRLRRVDAIEKYKNDEYYSLLIVNLAERTIEFILFLQYIDKQDISWSRV